MSRTIALSSAAALLLLAACTKAANPSGQPSSSQTPTSQSPTATCSATGDVAAKTATAAGGVMLLTNVAAAAHPCFDRVVFTFKQKSGTEGTPGYRIEYRRGPFAYDPSDKPLAVAGAAFLFLRVEPASGADLASTLPSIPVIYAGPKDFKPSGTAHIAELVEAGDFENVLSWVVGLNAQAGYAVSVLRNGDDIRLVIDVG